MHGYTYNESSMSLDASGLNTTSKSDNIGLNENSPTQRQKKALRTNPISSLKATGFEEIT